MISYYTSPTKREATPVGRGLPTVVVCQLPTVVVCGLPLVSPQKPCLLDLDFSCIPQGYLDSSPQ